VPDCHFEAIGARASASALVPTIAIDCDVRNDSPGERIQATILRCQIQIEAPRRAYSAEEQTNLRSLFGEPDRWSLTLKPLHWTSVSTVLPAFKDTTSFSLEIPCTLDIRVAASQYFLGLKDGTVPLTLLFSGSIFYEPEGGRLQAFPVSWKSEARLQFPAALWKDVIDLYYPYSSFLTLRRDVFERLHAFKVETGSASFEDAIELMMSHTLATSA
jgi:Family of unknown function (DUF6084)